MHFGEHELFKAPTDPGAPILRYINLAKLISMLARSVLFFSRSDKLGDAFEGSMTQANLEFRPELYKSIPPSAWADIIDMRQRNRLWTFINCWTASSSESMAMWRLYVGEGDGLAIESTYDRLKSSVSHDKRVKIGLVHYADWTRRIIPEENLIAPFLYKRGGFEYEHEVRALILDMPTTNGDVDWSVPTVPGLAVAVDVGQLVTKIRLSPVAEVWYRDVVESVITKFGYNFDVIQSELSGEPVF